MLPIPESHHAAASSVAEAPATPLRLLSRPVVAKAPPESDGGMSLDPRRVINGLKYHWFLFLVLGTLSASGLGVLAWELLPSKYTTYSVLRVAAVEPERIVEPRDGGRSEFVTYIKTQANLIKSEFVIRAALRDSNIGKTETLKKQEDPIRFLEENLITEFSENSEILKIVLTGDNAKDMSDIVNAVTAAYMKEVVHRDQTNRKAGIEELERIRKSSEESLKNTQELLKNRRKPLDSPASMPEPPSSKVRLAATEISRMNEDLRRAEIDVTVAAQKVKQLEARLAKIDTLEIPAQDFEILLNADPEYRELQHRVENADKRATYLKRVSTDANNPDYRDALDELAKRQRTAEDYRRKAKGDRNRVLQAVNRRDIDKQLEEARTLAIGFDLRARTLRVQLANVEPMKEVVVGNKVVTDVTTVNPEEATLLQMSAIHDLLNRKIQIMNVETQTSPRVAVVQQASVPIKKDMKKQLLGTGFAGLMGFALIGACVTLYESRVRRAFGVRDVTAHPNVNVIGQLPEITSHDPRMQNGKADPFMEAVDQVRVLLGRNFLGTKAQTILIASAGSGEGKTTLAGHLAVSMTKTDRKTILVDCNLREPGLHEHLGMAQAPGVCDVLRGEQQLTDVVQRTAIANLWFLSAGQWDAQAQQAIGRDRIRRILDKLRQDFDTIIIDSHALLPVADTLLIGQHCDAVVVCARKYVSRTHQVEQAYQRVTDLGVPQTGMIFMGEAAR